MAEKPEQGTFEIGLVMAGAISAGAYTAGVISFLLDALDAWYLEKEAGNPSVPKHNVTIRVISGTSAGGMTAGILAMSLYRELPPVMCPQIETHSDNPLFEPWINMADIEGLLRKDDRYHDPLPSLLDSTLLERIADTVFTTPLPHRRRPYISRELHLILCLTNLRGIPYELPFKGDDRDIHSMTTHADYLHFLLTEGVQRPVNESYCRLNPFDRSDDSWQLLRQSCLASGAFPFGLAARRMEMDPKLYCGRIRPVPMEVKTGGRMPGKRSMFEEVPVDPCWPEALRREIEETGRFAFWASDGGLINNEPFELARKVMAGNDPRLERTSWKARRMLIMIDPFIGRSEDEFTDDTRRRPSLPSTALKVMNALRSQARFKAEELALALDPMTSSRFMIAPKRTGKDGKKVVSDKAIASGSLGGFGGFLDRSFRVHDYLLGRRNCQKFLLDRLVLEFPPDEPHPAFGITFAEAKRMNWVRATEYSNGCEVMPVIPLMESVNTDPGRPGWPELGADRFDRIAGRLLPRLDLVTRKLSDPLRWYCRMPLLTAWWMGLRWITRRKIMEHIRRDLAGRGLMRV